MLIHDDTNISHLDTRKLMMMMLTRQGGSYQKIDCAAHAVVAAVIAHHGAVVKETNEEPLHQGDKVLHLWPQRGFLSSTVQQSGRHASTI